MASSTLKSYYRLTKPGIVYGNSFAAIAGFFLASQNHFDAWLLIATLAGLGLVIGSACVFNNYIDRDIDAKMLRTKKRALASSQIPVVSALVFGSVLGIAGLAILAIWANLLTGIVALVGWLAYVGAYSYSKRRTVHGTLIGSISGATPPVIGYTAVSGQLDWQSLILFLILVFWQMPHFYAIAIYRLRDYKAANIPVLPLVKGVSAAKKQIMLYIAAFTLAALSLSLFGYAGYGYFLIMLLAGLYWLSVGWRGFKTPDNDHWAREMFGLSLIVLMIWVAALSLDSLIG